MADLREAIGTVRAGGRPVNVRCPGHDDSYASLSVGLGADGKVLLKCHAGCETIAVLNAAGLGWSDVGPERKARMARRGPRKTRYEIRDLDGTIIALHERIEERDGKRFIWRRPDGVAGLGGQPVAELPLYGAHRLGAQPPATPIVVAEGEVATDALTRAGLLAVGTVTGASGMPSDESLRPLVAHPVALWPDHDEIGRDHMRQIGLRLRELGCDDIRIVQWREAPPHGDAADFRGNLVDLVAAAPVWTPMPGIQDRDSSAAPVTPCSLADLHTTFRRWLGVDYDLDAVNAVVATAAAERLAGDPLWLLLVSGSGNAKTETVQALSGAGAIVTSTITSDGALLSASPRRERTKDATGGLLRSIGSRGVLVIKDVTSILSMNRDSRGTVLAALREIHDGRWERNVGTDGGRTLSWAGRLAIVGAVTTAWDRAHDVVAAMGDRFVVLRMDSSVGRGRDPIRWTD